MKSSVAYKWVVILFFAVVGIIFTVSVIYLAMGNVAPDTYWGRKMTLPKTEDADPLRSIDKYILELDQAQTIGNRIFLYQGRQVDHIVLNVIIPEIDRQYSYPFRISIPEAKNGVEVAGIRFQLIAVRPNFVSVKVMH